MFSTLEVGESPGVRQNYLLDDVSGPDVRNTVATTSTPGIHMGKDIRQADTISTKLFSASLQLIMKSLNSHWKSIRFDGKLQLNVHFTDDNVIFSRRINEAETMTNEPKKQEKDRRTARSEEESVKEKSKVRRQAYQTGWFSDYRDCLIRVPWESSKHGNNMKEKLEEGEQRGLHSDLSKKPPAKNDRKIHANFFDTTVLPAFCYTAETWVEISTMSRILRTTHRALKKRLLEYNWHTQYLARMRSSDLWNLSHLGDPGEYTSIAKHRWAGNIMRSTGSRWTKRIVKWTAGGCKPPQGRQSIQWADCS